MSRPWMPLYIPNYLGDTGHLSTIEHGAYLLLIMHYWQHGGLPDDDHKLAMITRMTADEWQQCRGIIATLFRPGWKHKRIDKELGEADARYERRAASARKSAEARSRPKDAACTSNVHAEPVGSNADAARVVVDVVVLKEEQLPINQETPSKSETKERKKGLVVARARPACRLPDDWEPTLADLNFAQNLLSDDRVWGEVAQFRDHWHAANGPNSVKRDWSAAWRNWCRNAVKFGAKNGVSRNGKLNVHEAAAQLTDRLRAIIEPAPTDVRSGEGGTPVRRLPPR